MPHIMVAAFIATPAVAAYCSLSIAVALDLNSESIKIVVFRLSLNQNPEGPAGPPNYRQSSILFGLSSEDRAIDGCCVPLIAAKSSLFHVMWPTYCGFD